MRVCSMKITLEEVERDRDGYKYKLSERNRELDRLSEQVNIIPCNRLSMYTILSYVYHNTVVSNRIVTRE